MGKILITGAFGQIGSELVLALIQRYGEHLIVASDIRSSQHAIDNRLCLEEQLDCCDIRQIQEVVRRHSVNTIYHLAALLSSVAEQKPQIAWAINMGGLSNILEVARQNGCAVFFPSSIGAFGPSTPRDHTPQITIQRPNSMYGITKVAGELLCDYYATRFGTDTRGIRLPGLISHTAEPGGGTTDYAVEIFYQAIRYQHYTCYLGPDTQLDMMYMPDAVRAMIELMEADEPALTQRNAYNVTAMSISPAQLAESIRQQIADFEIDYEIDPVRQAIADSWPRSMDDSDARADWGWKPQYNLNTMTADMVLHLNRKLTSRGVQRAN